MDYMVDLDAFYGPMDLLLYLIDKNEIDIYDIPIADITGQYIDHIQYTGDVNLDTIGDFLSMASYLMMLKSKMLLPVNNLEETNEEEGDPREELVQRLLEYRNYKKAAQFLMSRQTGDVERIYYRNNSELPDPATEIIAESAALLRAYQRVARNAVEQEVLFHIPEDDVDVEVKMGELTTLLKSSRQGIVFQDLFLGAKTKREIFALFMALLELIRLQQAIAVQENDFSEIKVWLAGEDIKC